MNVENFQDLAVVNVPTEDIKKHMSNDICQEDTIFKRNSKSKNTFILSTISFI